MFNPEVNRWVVQNNHDRTAVRSYVSIHLISQILRLGENQNKQGKRQNVKNKVEGQLILTIIPYVLGHEPDDSNQWRL